MGYRIGGFDADQIRASTLLTNSRWMSNVVQDVYDVRPEVVHPPVDTEGFEPHPWDEREDGFVTVDLLCTHRYGLHGKRHEHFGMAVAELVSAGVIPFVPDNGGQRDIVDRREELLYRTPDEANEKIDRVLTDLQLRRDVRFDPERVEARFGRNRFREEIRMYVQAAMNGDATPRRLKQSPTT